MWRRVRLLCALAVVAAMYSCSSDESGSDTALAPTPISALRGVLVVT